MAPYTTHTHVQHTHVHTHAHTTMMPFIWVISSPTHHSCDSKKEPKIQKQKPVSQNIYLCQNFAEIAETPPQWEGAHIMLGQISHPPLILFWVMLSYIL